MLDDEVEGQRILLLGDNDVDAEGSQVLGGVRGGFVSSPEITPKI